MYSVAFDLDQTSPTVARLDPRARQIARIIEMRNRVMESRDLLYCSPEIRRLIEDDMSLLINLACAKP